MAGSIYFHQIYFAFLVKLSSSPKEIKIKKQTKELGAREKFQDTVVEASHPDLFPEHVTFGYIFSWQKQESWAPGFRISQHFPMIKFTCGACVL